MKTISYVKDNLEDFTHDTIKRFFKTITDYEKILGENMKNETKRFSYDMATAVINLIKDGNVVNVDEAAKYGILKTGIKFSIKNEMHYLEWKNLVKVLEDYNGGNKEIKNVREVFALQAKDKILDVQQTEKGLPFAKADLLFDYYKRANVYPHISLLEGSNLIRDYKKGVGEKRSVQYEAIAGLRNIMKTPEHLTYMPMDVNSSYAHYQDSGHGWLEVPTRELKAMGLESRITPYSYLNKDKAYLEEDLDAGTFLDMRGLLQTPFSVLSKYLDGSCYIRDFPHYRPEAITPENVKPERKNKKSQDDGWER